MGELPTTPTVREPVSRLAAATAGMLIGGAAALIGVMLSFTGLGIIIGLPLMVVGLALPLVGVLNPGEQLTGPCPYCGCPLVVPAKNPGVNCGACQRRVGVRGEEFVAVERAP